MEITKCRNGSGCLEAREEKEEEIPPDGKQPEDDSSNEIDELQRASILVRLPAGQPKTP